MLTAPAMPSRQSGQERRDEAMRDELRGMIATSGKNRQDYIKAQRESVELHEKHPFNKSVPATKNPVGDRDREARKQGEGIRRRLDRT